MVRTNLFLFFLPFSIGTTATAAASIWQYSVGKSYNYDYSTRTDIKGIEERGTTGMVNMDLQAKVTLTPLMRQDSEYVLKLQAHDASIQGSMQQPEMLHSLTKYYLLLHWVNGKLVKLYMTHDAPSYINNILKGIASLLQSTTGVNLQTDTSGTCYVSSSSVTDKTTTNKTHCSGNKVLRRNRNEILGVSVISSAQTGCDLTGDIIKEAISHEVHDVKLNIRESVGASVESRQTLVFVSEETTAVQYKNTGANGILEQINKGSLFKFKNTSFDITQSEEKCSSTCKKKDGVLDQYRSTLTSHSMASIQSAKSFIDIVKKIRQQPAKEMMSNLLFDSRNDEIIPQLIDILTAVQTRSSQEVLMEYLNFDKEDDIAEEERYLLGLAFTTHPTEELLSDLLNLYKRDVASEYLRESIALGLGATVYTFCQLSGANVQSQVVQDIENAMLQKEKECEAELCYLIQIRAMSNARFPDSIHFFTKHAVSKHPIRAIEALKGIERLGKSGITDEVKEMLLRLFLQTTYPYESEVRTSALNVLLMTNPTLKQLKLILKKMDGSGDNEMVLFVMQLLQDKMKTDTVLRKKIRTLIWNNDFNLYNVSARKGFSCSFSSLLAETLDTNATYTIHMESSSMGVMKRSRSDFILLNNHQDMPLLSFGLYSRGLDGVIGGNDDDDEDTPSDDSEDGDIETSTITAGMSLDIMGVSLRPIVFFHGVGGMMNAIWNLPTDPVTALQGNLLLQDHSQHIALQNGFLIDLEVLGSLSLDLSGALSVSLWNRQSQSVVNNSGAIVTQGTVRLATGPYAATSTFSMETAATLQFSTLVNFSDKPFTTCMKMSQSEFNFRHNQSSYEHFGAKRRSSRKISHHKHINAASFPFHKQNSLACQELGEDKTEED